MNKQKGMLAALYFVGFESAYWALGNRFFAVMQKVVFFGDFSWLQAPGDIAMFIVSAPGLLFSLFCLGMCFHTIMLGVKQAQKEAIEEVVM